MIWPASGENIVPDESPSDAVLKGDSYQGTVTSGGGSRPISFKLSADADCRLRFIVDPVDTQTYLLVAKNSGKPGETEAPPSLAGRSADGKTVASDGISVRGWGSNKDGHYIRIAARVATVTHPSAQRIERPILRLWLRSFVSFRNAPIETPLGTLAVHGNSESADCDEMSGSVAVQAPSSNPDAAWRRHADDFLRHMHRGLALAHGGRLQTPRLDYAEGDSLEITFFAGSAFEREFPVQYQLNHDPFIRSLAERYFNGGPFPEVLWTALGWMQTETTFDEIRFLTAMTALESVIEGQLPERRGTIIPKSEFKPLRKLLEGIIAASAKLQAGSKEILLAKIAGLNKKTLSEKITSLFDHFDIPRRDFEGNTIVGLIKLRNEIVHRGGIPDGVDLWRQIILVRELLTRILLKEMGFKGQYCCYIGGLHDRNFPE
jgi:hypothetical protein